MVPYRGRLALRLARTALAVLCLAEYLRLAGFRITWVMAVLAAYTLYSVGALLEVRYDTPVRAAIGTSADTVFFAVWAWFEGASWPPALAGAYLLASATMSHDLARVIATSAVGLALAVVLPPRGATGLVWSMAAACGVAVPVALYKRFLEHRMSNTLRHNVIIRSQAESARETERQRIAADFHDGPLQSFISFQMRLEIVRKLLTKDVDAAAAELRQLQDLCRSQVTDLRSFVRSMRPTDDGASLPASLSRMLDSFQKDTGISTTFSAGDLRDPAETEVSLELLQIVREALNNVQKHSGATRVAVTGAQRDRRLEVVIEDNGIGLPFTGTFSLDELELLRMGPVSIKRRVRMVNGELTLESRPGQGTRLEIRIPV
jgi:signal transduction histidine kinase